MIRVAVTGTATLIFLGAAVTGALPSQARPLTVSRTVSQTVSQTAAQTAASSEGWGGGVELPGSGALNAGGAADVLSVSCTAPGDCAAGGYYASDKTDAGRQAAMVAAETDGRWGKATGISTRLLGSGFVSAEVSQISCSSPGNCGAVGSYLTPSQFGPFVATERAGRWGTAILVPGTAAGGGSVISCPSDGNCAAGGSSGNGDVFVASQRDGTWQHAIGVPGLSAFSPTPDAALESMDCSSPGNCVAGGFDQVARSVWVPFLVTQRGGRWRNAFEVPGLATLNKGEADVFSVSCPSTGNCAAAGSYTPCCGVPAAFVVSEHHGVWGKAVTVERGGAARAISCASAGNCTAGGDYTGASKRVEAFVVTQRHGVWGKAIEDPGIAALNTGGRAAVQSISCTSSGNCGAGGYYFAHGQQAFVQTVRDGRWGKAIRAPGLFKLNRGGDAEIDSVSCAGNLSCGAGGYYSATKRHHMEAFVISRAG